MFNINQNNTPLSINSLKILYSANNIEYDLVELFDDFSQSFLLLIFNTYLGDEITNSEDKVKHFNWCWNKNISNFGEEGIFFEDSDETYHYFLEFMINFFYLIDKRRDFNEITMTIRIIWSSMFNYNKAKTTNEVDNFFKIYSLLEKSLKNAKKA